MPPQSRSSQRARRVTAVTLELKNGEAGSPFTYTFNITPQGVEHTTSSRDNPQQTLGGAYIEEWGEGFGKLVLNGHTGFAERVPFPGMDRVDGYQAFQDLKRFLRRYLDSRTEQRLTVATARKPVRLFAHLWESDDHLEAVLDGDALRVSRNDQTPLLFPYTLSLTVIGPASASTGLKATLFPEDGFGIAGALEDAENSLVSAGANILRSLPLGNTGFKLGQAIDGAVSAARVAKQALRVPKAVGGHFAFRMRQGADAARSVQREVAELRTALDINHADALTISRAARHMECALTLADRAAAAQGKTAGQAQDSLWAAAQRARMGC